MEPQDSHPVIQIIDSHVGNLNIEKLVQIVNTDRLERSKREWRPIPNVAMEGDLTGERLIRTVCFAAIKAAGHDPRDYWSCAVVASYESVPDNQGSTALANRIYTPNIKLVAGLDFIGRLHVAADEGRQAQLRDDLKALPDDWSWNGTVPKYGDIRAGTLSVDRTRKLVLWTPFKTTSTRVSDYPNKLQRTSELLELMCTIAAAASAPLPLVFFDDVLDNRSAAWLNFLACTLQNAELRFRDILVDQSDDEQWDFLFPS